MTAGISLPKHWEDWCKWLLGFWLCISPWILHFDPEPKSTLTAVITGLVIVFVERLTLFFYQAWEQWINALLGAWLVICPAVLTISSPVVRENFLVVGLLILTLTLYEIWEARRQSGNHS
jgi:hypothetical protein